MPGRGRQLPDLRLIRDDMVDPVVRPARSGDVEQLRTLEREACAALVGRRGGDRWLETHAARGDRWDDAVAAGGVEVAVIGDVVAGYLVSHHGQQIAYIDEVYVTPGCARRGLRGRPARGGGGGRSCGGLQGDRGRSTPWGPARKNLYERAGITARLLVVSKTL